MKFYWSSVGHCRPENLRLKGLKWSVPSVVRQRLTEAADMRQRRAEACGFDFVGVVTAHSILSHRRGVTIDVNWY